MPKEDFETFFKQHKTRIYHQIYRLNIHRSQYSEFYTEGLVALWGAYKKYNQEKGNLGTYLNYTIRHKLLDLLRKKIRQNTNEENYQTLMKTELTTGNRTRHTNIPLLEFQNHDIRDQTFWRDIRSKLTDKQWKWVHYFIIAELTIQEITEIENVSADAVKSWGQQAKKKLKNEAIKTTIKQQIQK